jgi:hypothetical protein
VKRRWAILFWTSLSALIGMSWMVAQFGGSLWSTLNFSLVGLICASAIAFVAMQRSTQAKWPAGIALACTAPMALQLLQIGRYVRVLVDYYGTSAILLLGGTAATAAVAIWILVTPLVAPPRSPPIAPARVVD